MHREYYLNDAGSQLDTFAASLMARYEDREPPDDGYHGAYLADMAVTMRAELGDAVTVDRALDWGYEHVVGQLRSDLARIGVGFDTWFSERTLHDRGDVADVLGELQKVGVTFEADGATWLRSSDYGDQRDRVLVRSDGTTTYLAADLAYHRDKLRRGWTHLIDIWGADHHGQVPSIQAGMQALGAGPGEPEVILGQLVRLERGGESVRLSKRAGDVVTLADILDEVDPDACRLTFLLQSVDTAQTIDLDVVTAQSMENPVYYVQYAHARIASITRHAGDAGVARRPLDDVDLAPLTDERELDLLRAVHAFDEVVAEAAEFRAPYKVTNWVRDLAGRFHRFYAECRVVTDDEELTQARLWLAEAVRIALGSGLGLLGVSAPESMERREPETGSEADSEGP
ncbi:MAG: arginine--tRNA ligase [Acidimicrobiia bacterium]|nr:arginine--tRNA ligase [Acidimicrobiia bacterium]